MATKWRISLSPSVQKLDKASPSPSVHKPVPKCPKRGRCRAGKVTERGDRGRGEGGETYFVVFGFQRG